MNKCAFNSCYLSNSIDYEDYSHYSKSIVTQYNLYILAWLDLSINILILNCNSRSPEINACTCACL